MLTSINTTELYSILRNTPSTDNIMLMGKHGIGKSEIVKTFFESQGKHVVTVFCSQAADPGDIIGLPKYNEKTGKTEFALPWWFPLDNTPVVLFLDELNRARPEILQVVMDLTLSRKLVGKELPAGSQIISAINGGDEYQLTELDPALLSRFNIYNFVPTVTEWLDWAKQNNINESVISFITTRSKYLEQDICETYGNVDKTPDRRAWVRVSNIMNNNPIIDNNLKKLLSGIIGGSAAVIFYEHIASIANITAEDVLFNFNKVSSHLKKYNVQNYITLIDSICSYINLHADIMNDSQSPEELNKIANGLFTFLAFLVDKTSGNREAFAFFVSNYESGTYQNLNLLIGQYPDLESIINGFIVSTNTR